MTILRDREACHQNIRIAELAKEDKTRKVYKFGIEQVAAAKQKRGYPHALSVQNTKNAAERAINIGAGSAVTIEGVR
jgi:hypothetical protein